MSLSRTWFAVCVAAIVCLSAAVAEVTLIDVQILGQSTGNPNLPPSYSGAAMTGAAGDVWNGYVVDSATNGVYDPAVKALSDTTGAATVATFKLTTAAGDNQAYSPQGTSNNALADSYVFAYTTPISTSFVITGLVPNSTCGLWLYSTPGNWGSGDTSFTVNGVAKRATNSGAFSSVGWVENDSFVHYASLTADGNGNVSGTLISANAPAHAGFLNGLQLQATLVPEPSAIALSTIGLVGLLAYAWRKRR